MMNCKPLEVFKEYFNIEIVDYFNNIIVDDDDDENSSSIDEEFGGSDPNWVTPDEDVTDLLTDESYGW